jgi:HSP20 family protein
MNVKKWIPWNWFKKEEEGDGNTVPVQRTSARGTQLAAAHPIDCLHREIDRLFEQVFSGLGLAPLGTDRLRMPQFSEWLLKPTLDLGATDKAYTISVEIPGVDEKDIKLELADDILTISGEKQQSHEAQGRDFYRLERAYGHFQRTLALPEDVDQDNLSASFKNGVLTVTMPRRALPQRNVRRIAVQPADSPRAAA